MGQGPVNRVTAPFLFDPRDRASGMPLSTTQRFRWGLYGATVLAGLIVAIGLINTNALTRRSAWVLRSASTARELEALQAALVDAETGQRGFLLTRDRRYLDL